MEKLFVGGFPLEIQELELVQLFSTYGEVVTVKIIRDRITKICKGYGFIEMASQEGAYQAIQALNGTPMAVRELSVRIADEKKKPAAAYAGSAQAAVYQKVESNAESAKKQRPKRPRLNK